MESMCLTSVDMHAFYTLLTVHRETSHIPILYYCPSVLKSSVNNTYLTLLYNIFSHYEVCHLLYCTKEGTFEC